MARRKKSIHDKGVVPNDGGVTIFEESSKKSVDKTKKTSESRTPKKECKVVLVNDNYIVVDMGGTNKRINGKFDLKIGDIFLV